MAAPVDRLVNQVRWAAELAGRDGVVGVHLEGPFLARARCGAQNQAHLVPPDPLVLARLLDAGQGTIRTITIAPELPGALPLIEKIAAAGVVAAVGHTDATYEQAAAGIAAGATLATHLFNAMGPIKQRAPGPALAALDSELFVELINDGIHVHDALGRLVGAVAPSRLCLVTDAISATGVGDGHYTLGDQPVLVDGGAARLAGTDRLAGSTLTMDEAFRRAVRDLGLSMEAAVAATSGNPARLLDLADSCGAIAPGLDADLVLLGDDLSVRGVMAAGAWLAPR
jgi:N-acetylglucosamine-6-phosphate deacetylase